MMAANYEFPRIKSRTQSFFAPRRSWRELLAHPSSYSRPLTFPDFTSRVTRNLTYFRLNYSIIILILLFLTLLYHPTSMIVFLIVFILWFYFVLNRDEPLILFNRMIDDRVVMGVLSVVMIGGLVLTGVWVNVVVAVAVGVAVVLVHAALRVTEDFYEEIYDEDFGAGGGLSSFVGSSSNAPASF